LAAAAKEGQPISAKFEVEDGKLQLSVYTEKSGKFSEVIVDYRSGKVEKAEEITEGDDLKDAQSQSAAMAKTKSALKDAVDKAMRRVSGSRAIGITPEEKDGRSTASVVLLKGGKLQTVSEPLN
jgi:hypothetical protein